MRFRAAPAAITTFIVAVVVALTVPISQLQTVSTTVTCCCPDPSNCHCPHEKPGQCPSMRTCHRERHDGVSPQAPSFTQPEVAILIAPPRIMPAPIVAPGIPHAEPSADEPYGPS